MEFKDPAHKNGLFLGFLASTARACGWQVLALSQSEIERMTLSEILVFLELASSKSDALRHLKQGGIRAEQERLDERSTTAMFVTRDDIATRGWRIWRGKRHGGILLVHADELIEFDRQEDKYQMQTESVG